MNFDSPLSASEATKKVTNFFEEEETNAIIKEKPLAKKDKQFLEVGITGGRWEVFWMKILATNYIEQGSNIKITSRIGMIQLTVAITSMLFSGPFLYLILTSMRYWLLIVPIFFFLLGLLSLIMPIVRIRSTKVKLRKLLTS